MLNQRYNRLWPTFLLLLCLTVCYGQAAHVFAAHVFAAGIFVGGYVQSINPESLPVPVNGGFLQQMAGEIKDPLAARTLVIKCGDDQISITVVDSCLVPRDLIDKAKQIASQQTSIPMNHMLVSATHAHSTPSVQGIHGSEADESYRDQLTKQIADSIINAHARLQPAQIGWAREKLDKYIYCRRWLMKPGTAMTIPFTGKESNQVQMNPGHANENRLSQTGPVDTDVMVLAFRKPSGEPLAILGNFNTHYAGAEPLSSDYFGHFCRNIGHQLGADESFVALMSNGTSGDANCIDFSQQEAVPFSAMDVAVAVMDKAEAAYRSISNWCDDIEISSIQKELKLDVRMPSVDEVAAAKRVTADWINERLPQSIEEVYQRETLLLATMPETRDVVLQVMRLGDMAITATPCEVYGETGMRIKKNSPIEFTMNIGWANDYLGYLPPPSQHELGGYTTWRARSSCLEVEAEPKVYHAIMDMLGQKGNKPLPEPSAGLRRNPIAPEESVDLLQVYPGLQVELAACEPNVIDPVHVSFDAAGRMWVVEMRDYPFLVENKAPTGRIRVLEDSDDDGFFETAHTFADRLMMPTGLTHFRDGVIATVSGKVVYLADDDHDLQCDRVETWFDGFSETNEQLRANHPSWTMDHKIHVASGLRGGQVQSQHAAWPESEVSVSLAARDFEFNPFGGQFAAAIGNSQFGFFQDKFGFYYVCDNRHPCQRWLVRSINAANNPLIPLLEWKSDVIPAAEDSKVYPLIDAWTTSTLHAGQFTAACGVYRYESDLLQAELEGDYFACEPTGSLVQRYKEKDKDVESEVTPATTRDRPGVEFLASTDPWFHAVDLTDGPDGAMYVVDIHRAVIEHPEWVPDELKNRPDERWGSDAGRIYRIVPRGQRVSCRVNSLADAPNQELVNSLGIQNRWRRLTAARLLAERLHDSPQSEVTEIKGQLRALLESTDVQSEIAMLQAFWLYSLRGEVFEETSIMERSNSVAVTRAIIELAASGDDYEHNLGRLSQWSSHDHPLVRIAFTEHFAGRETEEVAQSIVHAYEKSHNDSAADRKWLAMAFSLCSRDHCMQLLRRVFDQSVDADANAACELMRPSVLRLGWEKSTNAFTLLVAQLNNHLVEDLRITYLQGLRQRDASVQELLQDCSPETKEQWRLLLDQATRDLMDSASSDAVRKNAIHYLAVDDSATTRDALQRIATQGDEQTMLAAISASKLANDPHLAKLVVQKLQSVGPVGSSQIVQRLAESKVGCVVLIQGLGEGILAPHQIGPTSLERMRTLISEEQKVELEKMLPTRSADAGALLARYRAALNGLGNIDNGRSIFAKQCASCHRLESVGFAVGPDLSDLRTQTPVQLLQSVLEPNAAIDARYERYVVLTTDSETVEGILIEQTANDLTLGQANGATRIIERENVESWRPAGTSMMPTGFENQILPADMNDLIRYLKEWRIAKAGIGVQ